MSLSERLKAHLRMNLRTYALMGLVIAGSVLWEMLFMAVFTAIGVIKFGGLSFVTLPPFLAGSVPAILGIFTACIMAPIVEESFFRWLPISIATDEEGKLKRFGLPLIFVWSGLFFGFVHGYNYIAVVHKAPMGMMLAGLWWANRHDWKKALLSCMAVHMLYIVIATIIEYLIAVAYMHGAQDMLQYLMQKAAGS